MKMDTSVTASVTDKQECNRVLPSLGGSSMWREVAKQIDEYELLKQSRGDLDSKEAVLQCLGHLEKESALLSQIFRLINIRVHREQRQISLRAHLLLMDLADFGVPPQEIEQLRQKLSWHVKQHLIQSYSASPLLDPPKFEMPQLSSGEHIRREPFILGIISTVDDMAREINARLNREGWHTEFPLPLEYLLLLANTRGSLPVTCLERLPERIGTDSDDSLSSHELILAREVLKRLGDKDALELKEVEELRPPLTYNEILSYYLRECSLVKEDLSFWAECYPDKRYCPECGKIFSPSKGHPYQLFCSRSCTNKARQRRHRKRVKESSPVLPKAGLHVH